MPEQSTDTEPESTAALPEEAGRRPVTPRTKNGSRTLLILVIGWLVVFGVLAWVLTSLKLGGPDQLKSDDAPTPALPDPVVR